MKLIASHLLKVTEDGILKPEMLEACKHTLIKRNKESKEKVALIFLCKAKILSYISAIRSNWKNDIDTSYKDVTIKCIALKYTTRYLNFILNKNEDKYELHIYGEESKKMCHPEMTKGKAGNNINNFIRIMKGTDIWEPIVTGISTNNLSEIYKQYMTYINNYVKKNMEGIDGKGLNYDDKPKVYAAIESFINTELYSCIFSRSPSKADNEFHRKLQELKSLKPSHFKITNESLEYGFWESAIQCKILIILIGLNSLDKCRSPIAMRNKLAETDRIITEGLSKFVKFGKDIDADDKLSSFNYVLIASAPIMFVSYLKYVFIVS